MLDTIVIIFGFAIFVGVIAGLYSRNVNGNKIRDEAHKISSSIRSEIEAGRAYSQMEWEKEKASIINDIIPSKLDSNGQRLLKTAAYKKHVQEILDDAMKQKT